MLLIFSAKMQRLPKEVQLPCRRRRCNDSARSAPVAHDGRRLQWSEESREYAAVERNASNNVHCSPPCVFIQQDSTERSDHEAPNASAADGNAGRQSSSFLEVVVDDDYARKIQMSKANTCRINKTACTEWAGMHTERNQKQPKWPLAVQRRALLFHDVTM